MWQMPMQYEPLGMFSEADAHRMHEALMHKQFGVVSWIRSNRKW